MGKKAQRAALIAQEEEAKRQGRVLLAWGAIFGAVVIVIAVSVGLLTSGNALYLEIGLLLLAALAVILPAGLVLIRNRKPPQQSSIP